MKLARFNSIFSLSLLVSCVCAVAVLILNRSEFFLYIQSPFIQGWDGQGMASIGQYYAQHIFPYTWGWTTHWLNGVPFPQFYPPAFFFVMAIFSKILPFVSYVTLFKAFVVLMQISVPGILVFFVAARTKEKWSLWLTGIFSVILISSYFPAMGNSGVNVASTLSTGMVTQLFGFIFLIVWLHFFLKIEENKTARYVAGFFLFVTFLSNAHDDIVTLLIFIVVFILSMCSLVRHTYDNRKNKWKAVRERFLLYFLSGGLPLLATTFWSLPLIFNYTYFTSISELSLPSFTALMSSMAVIPLFAVIGFLIAIKKPYHRDLLVLSTIVLVVLFFMYMPSFLGVLGLPTHVNRWFGVISFFLPIIVGLFYKDFLKMVKIKKRSVWIFISFVVVFVLGMGTFNLVEVGGYYSSYSQDNFKSIVNFVQTHPQTGILMTESLDSSFLPSMFVYDAALGLSGSGAAAFDLRESSINSVFTTPIRNSLSSGIEIWGFESYLARDPDFLNQNISEDLDRASNIGIQSFLIRSKQIKDEMLTDPRIKVEADFGNWILYTFKNPVPRAQILSQRPVLFYGDLTFKSRSISDYDWSRIQEELLYNDNSNIHFMYPPNQYIDSSIDFGTASTTLIVEYKYHDLKTAYDLLSQYSQHNNLILIADTDPLFIKMYDLYEISSTTNQYHLQILDRLMPSQLNPDPLRAQLGALFEGMTASTTPVDTSSSPEIEVTCSTFTDSKITVILSGTSTVPLPVLVKSSYFPAWRRADGVPVYLATPGFILTYATSSFEINFTTPAYVYIGVIISVLVFLISGILFAIYIYRKKYLIVS